jgi:RNA polymerase sigma-70 factor (sigma-E family)
MGSPDSDDRYGLRAEFDRFALRVSPGLLRAAYLLSGDRGHAEDLLQGTLLRVARRWEAIEHSPEAYAREVLVNLSRDRVRGLRRRPSEVLEVDMDSGEIRDFVDRSLDRAEISEAIQALPDRQRQVIVMRFFLDMSVAETAQTLGSSEGTVKSHTARALAGLRKLVVNPSRPRATRREVRDAQ